MSEPLVLVPGMMCDARVFGPQIRVFARTRSIHLAPITNHETIEEIASEVLAAAPRRFALAGFSMGGIVAMEMFRQEPERVARLALLDTNASGETPKAAALREPQIVRVMAGSLQDVMRDDFGTALFAAGPRAREAQRQFHDMALELGGEVFVRQSRALQRRPDLQQILSRIGVPTLVMCGAEDQLCPASRHEVMAGLIPHATLKVVPQAGHFPTLEQPEMVIEALEQWLDESRPPLRLTEAVDPE